MLITQTLYSDIMTHWQQVLPGFAYEIQYEELVANQLNVAKDLFSYYEIKSDKATRDHCHNNPLHQDHVERWRHYEKGLVPLLNIINTEQMT